MKKKWILICLLLPMITSAQVTVDWVENTGGISIALDGDNNVYTVDYVQNPGGDIVLTKRSSTGSFVWEAVHDQTDNTRWERVSWVEVDHNGNIVVTGTSMSGFSNPVTAASIVMKFDPNGNLLWRNVYENTFDGSSTRKCIIDNANNIYVLGLGSGPNGFVTKVKKFSPSGTALWSYFDNAGIGQGLNFKFTPDNHIIISAKSITGSIMGYAKIDLNGNQIWSLTGLNSLTVGDAAGDAFGNTYCVHGEYVSNGGTVIRKISPNGTQAWMHTYPLTGFRVEVGSDNLPVVSGFPNSGSGGSTFIKVDGQGNQVWFNADADGPNAFLLHAQMKMDQFNHVYLAAGTLFEMGVCKVNSDGSSAWYKTMPGSYANGLSIGSDYHVYVVGGRTARIIQGVSCPVPANLSATNLTPSSATLNWGSVTTATNYQLQYRIVGASVWQTGTSNTPSFVISGLTPASLYEFRVAAQCGFNSNSDWSQALRFTTLALPCLAPSISQISVNDITTTSAWLNCSMGGMIAYDWRYRLAGTQDWIDLPAAGASFVQLTGLTHSTTYEFQVAVQCNVNWSDWSTIQTFTSATPPCITPILAQLSVTNITTSSARLNCGMTGVDQYDWRYRISGTTNWTDLPATTVNFIIVNGLVPLTTYEYQVAVQCQSVWTNWSAALPFTTEGSCPAPALWEIFATNTTSSGVRLNCAVSGANSYDWRYRVSGSGAWIELPATVLNFTDISSLEASTAYEFQVAVLCSTLWSDWSVIQIFSTSSIPCPVPDVSQLLVTNITATTAILNCNLTGVNAYDWRYRLLGATTWINLPETTINATILTNLAPATQYEFEVAVQCGIIWAGWSEPKLFMTLDAGCTAPSLGQLFVSNIMPTSARLNCSVTAVDGYDWRYRTGVSSSWTDLPGTLGNFTDITGLTPFSQYEFQVSVLCGSTWSPWSGQMRFLTPGFSLSNDGEVTKIDEGIDFTLYPVPAYRNLTLEYHLALPSEVIMTIVSGTGAVVFQEKLGLHSTGEYQKVLDLSGLAPGMYLVHLQTDLARCSRRFLKAGE